MTAVKNSLALCIAIFLLLFMVEMCYAKSSTILVSTHGFIGSYQNDIAKHLAEYIARARGVANGILSHNSVVYISAVFEWWYGGVPHIAIVRS